MSYYYPQYHTSSITRWTKGDIPASLRDYVGYTFESSSSRTKEFDCFDRKFKNFVKSHLPEGYELIEWHKMHFEASAFIKTPDGKYIYLSYDDVRYSDSWHVSILIRTAMGLNDYRGGYNCYTDVVNFTEDIQKLY